MHRHPFSKIALKAGSGIALDIGCGDFTTIRRAFDKAEKHFTFLGLEVAEDETVYGPSHLADDIAHNSRFERRACDIEREPFPVESSSIDIAFASHVIEHLQNPQNTFEEAFRVLRRGGYLYVETPGRRSNMIGAGSWLQRTSTLPDRPITLNFYDDPTHVRPYTSNQLIEFGSAVGLTGIESGMRRAYGALSIVPSAVALAFGVLMPKQSLLRYHLVSGGWFNFIGWAEYAIMLKP